MKKYENYKDSGIDWLGEIPSHWEVKRLKNLFREINERSDLGIGELLSVSQYTGVTKKSAKISEGGLLTNAVTLEGYKIVKKNQLVSNIMLAWNGSLAFSEYDGITSPAYCIYELIRDDSYKYFHYLLKTDIYKSEYKRHSSGVIESRLRLYTEDFFRIWSVLPPLQEQKAIATFLDEKCSKIDKAVEIKEKQIALLKEQRQIIIHNAVTKGIDKNVTLKDSGVDWIGEIPEHWEVRRFKFLCSINTGSKNTEDKEDLGKYPFYVRSQTEERINSYSFDGEAILTAGDGAGVGKVYHYVNGKFDYHQRVYKFSNFNLVKGKYLYLYLLSEFYKVAILGTAKSTVDSLRLPLIQDFYIVFPNDIEQQVIIDYLEEHTFKIDKAIEIKTVQIEKLKEYKQSLINEVVTGKVRVSEP